MHRTCIVIGSGPQLGAAVGRRFGQEGFTVALLARNKAHVDAQSAEMRALGIDAHPFDADARDPVALRATVESVVEQLGPAGVLAYNAASQRTPGRVSDMPLELARLTLNVNLLSPISAVQAVLPAMRQEGAGTVLFTGGAWGLEPSPDYAPLGFGKAALRNLCFALAKEVQPWGVHAAMVTIFGTITAGTPYDSDLLADAYWALHVQPEPWERELQI